MPFIKGECANPGGKVKSEYRKLLDQYVAAASKTQKRHIVKHMIERAYQDDSVLIALVRKLLPDLKSVDIKTTQDSPFRLLIDVTPQPMSLHGDAGGKPVGPKRKRRKRSKSKGHND